jgi:hypothetical protein
MIDALEGCHPSTAGCVIRTDPDELVYLAPPRVTDLPTPDLFDDPVTPNGRRLRDQSKCELGVHAIRNIGQHNTQQPVIRQIITSGGERIAADPYHFPFAPVEPFIEPGPSLMIGLRSGTSG